MKEFQKKLTVLFVIVILILSVFIIVLQYQIKKITEEELPLLVKVFADKEEGFIPHSVNFTSLVLYYEGGLKYNWDFGDGDISNEMSPSHIYEEADTHTCTLAVTDESGKKITDSLEVMVKINNPPTVTPTLNIDTLERKFVPILSTLPLWPGDIQKIINGLEARNPNVFGEGRIVCTAQIDDPENDEIVSYQWVHQAETQLSQFGKPEQPTHYFEDNESILLPEIYTWSMGRHVIKLTVEDSAGNTANASIDFQVEQSLKKIQRNQVKNLFRSALNQCLLIVKPFFGVAVAGILLSMWKYSNFTGIKLVTLAILTFLF